MFNFLIMSTLKDKYINPLTDFGFKKLFEAAEIAKFSAEEREAYEDSLKYYRDLKNVVDTSKQEGIKQVAKKMKESGESIEKIMKYTKLSIQEIKEL